MKQKVGHWQPQLSLSSAVLLLARMSDLVLVDLSPLTDGK